MGILLQQLLTIPALIDAKVLAGNSGLTQEVNGVSIVESPNSLDVKIKNTLILTNEYFFELMQHDSCDYLLSSFSRNKASGICIRRTKGLNAQIPTTLIKFADKIGFPVIELPFDSSIASIINAITYEIFHRNYYNFRLPLEENLFQEMIFAETDKSTLARCALMLGIRIDEDLGLMLIKQQRGNIAPKVAEFCRTELRHKCFISLKNNTALILVRIKAYSNSGLELKLSAEELYDKLSTAFPGEIFYIGTGRCYKDRLKLRDSFYEARLALTVEMAKAVPQKVAHFDEMGLYRILFDKRNKQELDLLLEETLGKIYSYDKEKGSDYLQLIKVFFNNNYSMQDTAKAMFVHYNTIRYRIGKIKNLFGFDLSETDVRMQLHICLRIAQYLDADRQY